MKKLISVLVCVALFATMLIGCGASEPAATQAPAAAPEAPAAAPETPAAPELQVIKLGIRADFISFVESVIPSVEAAGYKLDITTFEDSIQPNVALGEGSIDVNWFQHEPYLNSYNANNGTDFVMATPYTHYPVFALYSNKWTSVEALPEGAVIGLCADATNQARGLKMLAELGLVTLKEDAEIPTTFDVVENPKKLEFVTAEMALLPQSLPDVDAIALAAQHMFNAGLNATDFLAESSDGPDYSLGFVTRPEDADAQWLADLVEAARCDALKELFVSNGGIQKAAY